MSRALVCVVVLGACASATTIASRWKDPDVTRLDRGQKVMAIVLARTPEVRKRAEDELARALPNAVPSHTVFTARQLKDRDHLRARLSADGYTAFAVMRFLGVGRGTGPASLPDAGVAVWDAYHAMWTDEGPPADAYVEIETRIFTVADGRLVWVATTDSRDPARLEALMDDVVQACRNQLVADGLIDR